MDRKRLDVVVLGGGLVGSAMSVALSGHGLRVALVDSAPADVRADPAFDGRAYAVAPGSRNLLVAIGAWDRVNENAQPIRNISVTDRTPGPMPNAGLVFDPSEAGRGELGWIVEDRFLRNALLDLLANSDVQHLAPARSLGVTRDATVAEVTLEDASPLRASLVVACDGRRSATARAAGVTYLGWDYTQTGLVSAIEHEHPHDGVAHQSFFDGGPFAVLPMRGNRSSLVWSERTEKARHIAGLSDADYLEEVAARIGGRLGKISQAGQRWAYPLGLALAQQFVMPRLVVAGDAAHGVHPIAGQGMNMGLRDVAALVEVVVDAARLGLDIGEINVLQGYERWRRFDATAMSLGMDGLNRTFSTGNPAVQAVRNLAFGGVAQLPAARRFFMDQASGNAGDVPRLLAGKVV